MTAGAQAGGAPLVVLVHGAWHGGWAWQPLVPRLHERGLRTLTVDLPGPARAPGRPDLAGHADAVAASVIAAGGDENGVVLCGHSYGGAVISEAAPRVPGLIGLVYIAAFQLAEGESCSDANPPDPAAAGPDPVRREGHYLHYDPAAARADFYHDCPDEAARSAVRRLTAEHVDTVTVPQVHAPWRALPSAYVLTARDRALPATAQRRMAARARVTRELDCGHSPMLSMPDQLADTLIPLLDDF